MQWIAGKLIWQALTIQWNVVANINRSCVVFVNAFRYMLISGGILIFTYSSMRSRSMYVTCTLYMLTLSADVGESGWATTCYGQWLGKHPNAFDGGLFSILEISFGRLSELAMIKSNPIPNREKMRPWDTSESYFFRILSILEYMRLGPDIDISSDVVGVKDPVQYFLRQAPSKPDLNQTCGHTALVFLLESA